ncbi:MAG: hypothetical protein ABFE13_25615 [Phycisphaerales bacterium]
MSLENALVTQAWPYMLAARAQALIEAEVGKGCEGGVLAHPVALEPAFYPVTVPKDVLTLADRQTWTCEQPPVQDDLIRFQVWLSPDQPFNWNDQELFVKQLSSVSHRVGLEIIGNREHATILLLCHRKDIPVVTTSFLSELKLCRLTQTSGDSRYETVSWEDVALHDYFPPPPYCHLLTRPTELHSSPYDGLMTAIAHIPAPAIGIYQVLFQPVCATHNWHRNIQILTDLEYVVKLVSHVGSTQRYGQQAPSGDLRQMAGQVETKAHNDKPFYCVAVRLAVVGAAEYGEHYLEALGVFTGLFQHGGRSLEHITDRQYRPILSIPQIRQMFHLGLTYRPGFLLNSAELTGLVHFPVASVIEQVGAVVDLLEPLAVADDGLTEGTLIGTYNHAGVDRPVYIPPVFRLRHTHLIGRPGMGKSTLEEHMVLDDIQHGHGVAVLDPHGDLVERLLTLIPQEYVEKTIHFDPGDSDWVPIWNPMQRIPGQDIGRMADDLVGVLKSFVTGWGDRMEHILRHSIFALLHLPGSTLLDIADILRSSSKESEVNRKLILEVVDNEEARRFWQYDFIRYRSDEFGPPKHKLSKLLVSGTVSLMLSQPNSRFNFRRVMDDGMIFLGNLSKLGTEVREILGGFILAILHATALGRCDTPPDRRRVFHIYLDEAHRFVTDALEDVIAETRKYGVSLTLAHQYLHQFGPQKIDALASVGTTVVFSVDSKDGAYLAKDFREVVKVKDIVDLKTGQAIVRCGTDVVRIRTSMPLEVPRVNCRDLIVAHSRKMYCLPVPQVRQIVERRSEKTNRPFEPLAPGSDDERRSPFMPKEFIYDEH